MDKTTKEFLTENAQSIYRSFLAGQPPGDDERQSLHTAYRLMTLLSQCSGDALMIGKCLGLSAHTVFEYAGVLEAAGIPIVRSPVPSSLGTGRPVTVFFLKEPPSASD